MGKTKTRVEVFYNPVRCRFGGHPCPGDCDGRKSEEGDIICDYGRFYGEDDICVFIADVKKVVYEPDMAYTVGRLVCDKTIFDESNSDILRLVIDGVELENRLNDMD